MHFDKWVNKAMHRMNGRHVGCNFGSLARPLSGDLGCWAVALSASQSYTA